MKYAAEISDKNIIYVLSESLKIVLLEINDYQISEKIYFLKLIKVSNFNTQ